MADTPSTRPTAKPAPARRRPPRGATVEIAATGDVTLGSATGLPAGGAGTLLAAVRRFLRADVTLGNLETALADAGSPRCLAGRTGCYVFRAPTAYAQGLARSGFTLLNVANNHALDYGAAGQAATLAALRAAGLAHAGRPGEISYQRAGPVRVAVLGFAPYPWAQSLTDLASARRLVRRASARADVVVVTMHAGGEGAAHAHVRPGPESYLGEPRGDVVAFSHAVVDAGADLVVGHGPHVVRGLEWYRGRLIAYSLGNLSAYRTLAVTGPSGAGAILRATLRGDGSWAGGRLVPLRLTGTGTPAFDPGRRALAAARSLSRQDFGSRAAAVAADGSIQPAPPRRAPR